MRAVQGTTPGRFGYPTDVEIDRAGNFYVAEYGENDRIQVFSPDGKWLRQWGGHGYEPGEFLRPRALAITTGADLHGQIIVTQGLAGGETIVNNPPQKLKDGDAIKVKASG